MQRRQFITLLGGAAASSALWPLAVGAQQPARMRRIGVLMNLAADDSESPIRFAAFAQGLQELGWIVGRNVRIDIRWGASDPDRSRSYAAELVGLAPDVILASGTPSVTALLPATHTVPIVFVQVADPVGAGFVDSLARPGGNATGFILFEYGISGKWLEPPMLPEPSLLWIQSDQRKHLGMLRCAQSPHLSPRAGMHAAGSPLKSP